jgi:site-specific DNA-cytosine methylase
MQVLSLFGGMECGRQALHNLGIVPTKYYSSEIDAYAMKVAHDNFPDIEMIGDICSIDGECYTDIDLLIGGSPCQSFSTAVSSNTGFDGKSKLFFEYVRILKETNAKYFFLENVEMKSDWENIITEIMGVEPFRVNSEIFGPQSRPRLYWTNIPVDLFPNSSDLVLSDILEENVPEKYFYTQSYEEVEQGSVCAILDIKGHDILKRVNARDKKLHCLTAVCGGNQQKKVIDGNRVRKLTPLEYERAQGLPDNYSSIVSDSQRYKMIGNGWEVNTIMHFFRYFTKENM